MVRAAAVSSHNPWSGPRLIVPTRLSNRCWLRHTGCLLTKGRSPVSAVVIRRRKEKGSEASLRQKEEGMRSLLPARTMTSQGRDGLNRAGAGVKSRENRPLSAASRVTGHFTLTGGPFGPTPLTRQRLRSLREEVEPPPGSRGNDVDQRSSSSSASSLGLTNSPSKSLSVSIALASDSPRDEDCRKIAICATKNGSKGLVPPVPRNEGA